MNLNEYLNQTYLNDLVANPNSNNQEKSYTHFFHQMFSSNIKQIGKQMLYETADELFGTGFHNTIDKALKEHYLYIHDMDKLLIPYCIGISTEILVNEGKRYGQLHSDRPLHARTYIDQVRELIFELSQTFAGAVAIGDLFYQYSTFTCYRVYNKKQVIQDFQSLIYSLNSALRVSGDSPFTNLSIFDKKLLKETFNITNKDVLNETLRNQLIFMELYSNGDPLTNHPFRFPIVTVNMKVKDGKIVDTEFLRRMKPYLKTGKFNIYLTEGGGKIASCCRMINDYSFLMKHQFDSFGNGGVNIGSHRVVTLNLEKMERLPTVDNHYTYTIDYYMDIASKILAAHRLMLERIIRKEFIRYFEPLQWLDLNMLFSTIGYTGLYECCNGNVDGMELILSYMKIKTELLSNEHKIPINLEQVPGENACVRLAKDSPYPILSNQYIPLWIPMNIIDRIKIAGRLDRFNTGGSINHFNLDSEPSEEQFVQLLNLCAEYGVTHFAITFNYNKCKNNHISQGRVNKCPFCDSEIIDKMGRVVGYFAWQSAMQEGRRLEYERRLWE